jgi:hypothetical protein
MCTMIEVLFGCVPDGAHRWMLLRQPSAVRRTTIEAQTAQPQS